MREVKPTQKREIERLKGVYKQLKDKPFLDLYHVYSNYSNYKAIAMDNCKKFMYNLMNEETLQERGIVSYNSQVFTYGIITNKNMYYITPRYITKISRDLLDN